MSNEAEDVATNKEPTAAQQIGVGPTGIVSVKQKGRPRSVTYQIMKQTVIESVQAGMNQTACAGFPKPVAI